MNNLLLAVNAATIGFVAYLGYVGMNQETEPVPKPVALFVYWCMILTVVNVCSTFLD